jgi:hypothetical protein
MGYFRTFFEANPKLLQVKSNDELIAQWKTDHPKHTEKDVKKARQNLANLKSNLRREARQKRKAGNAAPSGGMSAYSHAVSKPTLETLEEYIDDCLIMAKGLDRDLLGDVINHLHVARNEVVLKLGPVTG